MEHQLIKTRFLSGRVGSALAVLLLLWLAGSSALGQILPSSSLPYGFNYADWSAKWWQWTLSQSTNQMEIVSGPISGPVQFLAGAPGSVNETRQVTIPAGTALFFPVLSTWDDNSDCPNFDTNTLAQLQATTDRNWSAATETTCAIDGVAVAGLDNPQTSSYFTQATPFSYTTALSNSVLNTVYGNLPCIPGGTTVSPAVADGVYLMLAPLAPGIHTIHFVGIVGPTNAPYLDVDLTYQITVLNAAGNFPPEAAPYGISYADWAAKWWQWDLSQSTDRTNLVSGPISAPVQFLAGAPGSITATRNVTLPAGSAVFFSILSTFDDNSDCPDFDTNTLAQLQATADGNWSAATETICTIDGVAVTNLDNPQTTGYFTKASPFSYTTALNDSVNGLPCVPGGTTISPAVADGVYIMTAPLAPGIHTIHFVGIAGPTNAPYVYQDLTYQVTVLTTFGNYPPAATPYGISFADWAAKWWQWDLSQSTDQINLVSGPIIGPVQFLAGAPGSITATRNVTLPAGTAVFFSILSTWDDNSDCPDFDTNTLAQLQATTDGNWSAATETTCTIDGMPVTGLDDPQTTSYYIQATPFSYVTATNDSVIGLPCVPGGTTISPAVADGVYLMSAPLTPGLHTIHFVGIVGPTNAPYMQQDITYLITSLPVSLKIAAEGSSMKLIWPQSTINYGLENSPMLNSRFWSPVTTSVQTNNGTLQTTVPKSGGSQYFRLRAP
ncbi:MAG: hypothetical protein ABSH48_22545 [Verrucomicrobiota bacterium]|jgi:hypothetical protein